MSDDLDQLFRHYHGELRAMAYSRLGDREAAADVVQDAFVRYASLSRAQRLGHVEHPRFFLWRIVRNLIIDMGRQRRRRGEHLSLSDMKEEPEDSLASPERLLEARQQLQLLRDALKALPPNCRKALLMNRLDGLTHAEIAGKLGVSASMVSKYIMQALKHCARHMGLA